MLTLSSHVREECGRWEALSALAVSDDVQRKFALVQIRAFVYSPLGLYGFPLQLCIFYFFHNHFVYSDGFMCFNCIVYSYLKVLM